LDSDLSYEDLLETHVLWEKQVLFGEEECGTRKCYVVKSEAGVADKSHYTSVTSWLDSEFYYPVRIEKVVRSTGIIKEFVFFGLRESKGVWSASQIEVKQRGRPGKTLFIVSRGSGSARMPATEFDPALLSKPW